MADLEVFLIHPTTEARTRARLDDTMTAQEVMDDLRREGFLTGDRFDLSIKGGAQINAGETLRAAGVQNGASLRILCHTDAGSGRERD